MKLYHYAPKENTVLKQGLLSISKRGKANSLKAYAHRAGSENFEDITAWLDSTFAGRSRAIRAFSEPIQWTEHSIICLKNFIDNADLFEIDISAMDADGLIEAVYVSPSILDFPNIKEEHGMDEILQKLSGIEEIDYSPIDWNVCDDKLQRRFAFVRYYLIVVKGGAIPPKYIKLQDKKKL